MIFEGDWMSVTRRCVFGALLSMGASLSGCAGVRKDRVRLTVVVEVDGQAYTGSSVQEYVNFEGSNAFFGMAMGSSRVRGDAVVIPLGKRGLLFMILCGASDYQASGLISRVLVARPANQKKWHLSGSSLPRFVAFRNPLFSRTVFDVNPQKLNRDCFGEDARLIDVSVEYTKEHITRGEVEKVLPWLADKSNNNSTYLTGTRSRYGNSLADRLQYEDFTGSTA